jgi:hypothetical protein
VSFEGRSALLPIIEFIIVGLKNPYMVLMGGDVLRCKNNSEAMGFDAISSYGMGAAGTIQV